MAVACPKCQSNRHIQKISDIRSVDFYNIIFDNPNISRKYNENEMKMWVHAHERFEESLLPPSKPLGGLINIMNLFFIIFMALLLIQLFIQSNSIPQNPQLSTSVIGFFGFLLFISICFYFYQSSKQKDQMMEYENTKALWDRLYYCSEHDIVFDPKTGRYTRPEKWKSLV